MRPPFERHEDTKKLIFLLSKIKVGEIITYDDMNKAIGKDVRKTRWLLSTARKACQDEMILFECLRTVGLRRLDDGAKVDAANKRVTNVRRQVILGSRELATAEYASLDDMKKIKHDQLATIFSVALHASKPKQLKKIENAVAVIHEKLPLEKTLKMLSNGG